MTGTVTWVGFDVHARSAHGAAIDLVSGEVRRMRFGPGVEGPIAWLGQLPGPVHACYEAGPTGFGPYRAAVAAGIRIDVIAPGKTPHGRSDRVKTDRKDAELLARLLLAGQLSAITVPPLEIEAAREMTRCRDMCRRDLNRARHRVSKMLCATVGCIPSGRPGARGIAPGWPSSSSIYRPARWCTPTCSPRSTD